MHVLFWKGKDSNLEDSKQMISFGSMYFEGKDTILTFAAGIIGIRIQER